MRTVMIAAIAGALLPLIAASAVAQTAPPKSAYPGEVALVQEPSGFVYRHFPTGLRLYFSDQDAKGKSNCNAGCAAAWPPLLPHDGAAPMGDWTIIARDDGGKQWAYQGRPVYVRYHDSPSQPQGDGLDGTWHFLEP